METRAVDEGFYNLYLWTAAIVFVVTFGLMLFLLIPTLRSRDKDKLMWKKRWNHVEIILLVTWMAAVTTAIPSALSAFSQFLARHNQRVAAERFAQASKFASQIANHRCNDPGRGFEGVCLLIRKLTATKVLDADVLADLANGFDKELEAAEKARLEWNWEKTEVMNLANYAREVSGFATDRDRMASISVTVPFPEWLLIFWPHLIAVGFALSLAKSLARYSLL